MDDLVISDRVILPATELRESFVRSSGPGGQHVNKTSSKVELRWSPATSTALSDADREWLLTRLGPHLTSDGDLVVVSAEERSQSKNRGEARRKLAALIRSALIRPRRRRPTRPTRSSIERRLDSKKQRSDRKTNRRKPPHD